MIVDNGLHRSQMSEDRFHEALAARLRSMGFKPSKTDFDLWLRPCGDHHECVATCVENLLVFSRDSVVIVDKIHWQK